MMTPTSKELDDLRTSSNFDPDWYLANYKDVSFLNMDPAEHYLRYGRSLGRLPCADGVSADDYSGKNVPGGSPDAFSRLKASVLTYSGPKIDVHQVDVASLPIVTVVMTAHNSESTITRAVESMIHQTWPKLEIIVVDDASNDRTWSILTELESRYRRILKVIRLQVNLGTYIAKNIAVARSKGEIIMFQDSDDYSHPDRVLLQASHLIQNPGMQANRSKYSRFAPETKKILPVDGVESKFGLITLAVRKSVFVQIGYFDPVRKAGDDEWFERMRFCLGRNVVGNLDVLMYLAEFREQSLAQDLISINSQGEIQQAISGDRADYQSYYRARHEIMFADGRKNSDNNPPIPNTAEKEIPSSVAALPVQRLPVVASMCSIPSRSDSMVAVVKAILPQVDHLNIYLDKYKNVPNAILGNEKISIIRSQDYEINYRDNAKFLRYEEAKNRYSDFYYFTLDDDLVYPSDYVLYHLNTINKFDRRVVIGFHGVIYEENPTGYFDRRLVYHYKKDTLYQHALVNNLGTGTTAFHSSCFAEINPDHWARGGMVDIFFSILARQSSIPMLCLARNTGWLGDASTLPEETTLYSEFRNKDALIRDVLVKSQPWGFQAIHETLQRAPSKTSAGLQTYAPAFSSEASVASLLRKSKS